MRKSETSNLTEDIGSNQDPTETLVAVIRLIAALAPDDQERVYMAAGQFVGMHMTINQRIADNLDELLDILKSSGVLGVLRR
jgi:hypothetical protein